MSQCICSRVTLIVSMYIAVPKPDLDDNQKRWLVVGICLHSVISPVLRKYVHPVVTSIYKDMTSKYNIQAQIYPNVLKSYPPTITYPNLNYKAVNKNVGNERNYDYQIRNEVDFSKLFLQTNMTNYTGFDDSCDSSALLGIILNIDTNSFPAYVKSVVDKVRHML